MAKRGSGQERGGARWMDLLKGLAALGAAKAARRVVPHQEEQPEAGRLGGEVSSRAMPATMRPPGPSASRSRSQAGKSEAGKEEKQETVSGFLPIAKRTFKEFGNDNGTLMGAAMAFYILLSLVPLVLVGVAIFGHFMNSDRSYDAVMNFVRDFFPAQKEMLAGAIQSIRENRGPIGGIGLVGLILTASGGFATMETAINIAWGAPNRNMIWNKVFALLMMLLIGALLILSIGVTTAINWAAEIPPLKWMAANGVVRVLGYLVSFGISGVMFTAIYKLFPNLKTEWKPSLIAGFITAFLWEVFKIGYTWYSASKFGNQEASQGTMGSFVGLIMWIYYSSALVLLGAELSWVLHGCPGKSEKQDGGPGSTTDKKPEGRRAAAKA